MDHHEFRVKAKEMVDYMADYLENVGQHRVYPGVQPGYLHRRLPRSAPIDGEDWDSIMTDVNEHIIPGLVHWQSPHMHAYFPALTSYPSIMGEMLSSALNVLCFTWASSPAGTELETIAMNWLGKALGLPECFLNEKDDSPGGGVIQTTASEATLVCLLAARTQALMELSKWNKELQSAELLGHLICYCSDQAHSSVEKAGLIGLVRMRFIETDDSQCMRGDKLEEAILADKAKGLVPFWVCATLGTTGSVAFDNLREIGDVCSRHSAWLHVDAAYAGTAFLCPEYRHWLDGIEKADSFAFNPSKWMMVNFDCTAMWVRDSTALHKTFNVNPIYLRHENSGKAIDYMARSKKEQFRLKLSPDEENLPKSRKISTFSDDNGYLTNAEDLSDDQLTDGDENIKNDDNVLKTSDENVKEMCVKCNQLHGYNQIAPGCGEQIQLEDPDKKELLHWQIPLSRRFRALKLWFVLRNYGISGLQKHVRESVRLAQKFNALVSADPRFEIPQPQNLGLVCFRLKGDNTLTERLLKRLNMRGHMHAVPACFKGVYVIRFPVTSQRTTSDDILQDWNEIKNVASAILTETFGTEDGNIAIIKKTRVSLKDTRDLNATFGTSLLLANSPMSPKIVNGTHAAIYDYEQLLTSCAKFAQLKMEPKDSPEMRRRIRGMKTCGKMFSLDSYMDVVQGVLGGRGGEGLPQCCEEEHDTSVGSSPGERSSLSSSPITSSSNFKPDYSDNQLQIPATSAKQFRSKSVDATLSGLIDAHVTVDAKNNEIVITPTGNKSIATDVQASKEEDNIDENESSKLTITGPGSYIKKLIQQFSEAPLESEDAKPESERGMSNQIKSKADALCKKCLKNFSK